jgi:Flp pilus assembly protein TadG
MNTWRKFILESKAESAIEFALVIPVCILIVFGIIEMAYVLWAKSSMNYATSYGSRYAFVYPTASVSDINNFALSKISLDGSPISFTISQNPTNVTIQGTFNYSWLVVPLTPITINTQIQQSVPTY